MPLYNVLYVYQREICAANRPMELRKHLHVILFFYLFFFLFRYWRVHHPWVGRQVRGERWMLQPPRRVYLQVQTWLRRRRTRRMRRWVIIRGSGSAYTGLNNPDPVPVWPKKDRIRIRNTDVRFPFPNNCKKLLYIGPSYTGSRSGWTKKAGSTKRIATPHFQPTNKTLSLQPPSCTVDWLLVATCL